MIYSNNDLGKVHDQGNHKITVSEASFDSGRPITMGVFQSTFAGKYNIAISKYNLHASDLIRGMYLSGIKIVSSGRIGF